MRIVILTIAVFFSSIPCSQSDELASAGIATQLLGSWSLVEYFGRNESNGVIEPYYGDRPLGNLIYTASGDMSVHLVDSRVGEFQARDYLMGTAEELKEAYEGYFGYYGTYTVDEKAQTVTHHVIGASYRGYTGSDMTRYFKLEGDKLSLTSGVEVEAGTPFTFHLVWERRDQD